MKKIIALLLAAILVFSLAACASSGTNDTPSNDNSQSDNQNDASKSNSDTASGLPALTKEEIHIGAVFNTEIGTEGFSYALGQGFQALEDAGYKVDYAFKIPESSECETAIENLISQGCNVIYATSRGFDCRLLYTYLFFVSTDY